jgi:hypothetical protein
VLLTLSLTVALAASRVGDAVQRRHRAQLVADVSALAGVASGAAGAQRVAAANDAAVIGVADAADAADAADRTVVVTVELDGVRAVAAAAPG